MPALRRQTNRTITIFMTQNSISKCLFAALLISTALVSQALPRDAQQVREFKKSNVCPTTGRVEKKGCKGHDVDHKQALMNGGADEPANMQYLAKKDHKAKTKQDIADCRNSYTCKNKRLAKPLPFTAKAKRRAEREKRKSRNK